MPSPTQNILFFICCFGALQGIILSAFVYFHPKSNRSSNIFLALFMGTTSLIMATPLLHLIIPWQKTFLLDAINFLVGPMMYLYVRSLKETITIRKAFPHLISFFIYFPFSYWWLSYLEQQYPHSKYYPVENLSSPITLVAFTVRYTQMVVYFFLSRKTLLLYQHSIRHLFSEISKIELNWIRWLIYGYLIIIIATILIIGLMIKYPQYFYYLFLLNIALVTPYIYLVTYKGITQPTIWQKKTTSNKQQLEEEMQEAEEIEIRIATPKPKTVKPSLTDRKINEIVVKIVSLMEEEKIYRESELTLQQLAGRLLLPTYQVSQAINDGMKKTFYDLVNGYRVEDAKRLLVSPKSQNYTILSIGFEAGFNSKTTFNTVFKKFTGLTPTDFREKEKVNLASA